jgi:hypothetical protein
MFYSYLIKSKWYIIFMPLAFSFFNIHSQNLESNYWFFGIKAGIKFLPNGPNADTMGVTFNPGAVASVSDSNGNLLFYADLINVYTHSHQIMINGSNSHNGGNLLIIKKPGNSSIYYLLIMEGAVGMPSFSRCKFLTIDTQPNGGLGAVMSSSYFPYNFHAAGVACFDKSNSNSKWIVFKSDTTDVFKSFLIDSTGIHLSSPITSSFSGTFSNSGTFIKSSPNSHYFCVAFRHPINGFDLYKFNPSNGTVSKKIFSEKNYPLGNEVIYHCFSPSSKLLFVSRKNNIWAYKIDSEDSTIIASSKLLISSNTATHQVMYDLQLNLNGNMYFINGNPTFQLTKKVSRIPCPDNVYDSLIIEDTIIGPLGQHLGAQFPTLNQTLYVNAHKLQVQNLGPAVACAGSPSQLVAYGASKDDFSWSPSTGLSCSNCSSPIASPLTTTTYRVIARATSCKQDKLDTAFVTVTVKDPPPNATLNADSVVCAGDSLPLYMARPHYFLVWSTGDTADTLFAKQPGLYSATAYGYCFVAPVSRQVYVRPQPALAVSPRDTTVCAGEPVLLRASTPDTALQWLSFATTDTLRVSAPGVYVAQVQNACGTLTDTATVRHSQPSAQFVADSTEGFAPFAFSAFSKPGKLQRRWLLNGQDVGSDSVLRVINLPTDTYDLVLAVVDSIGCTDTSRLQLKVFPPPVPPEPPVPEPEPEPETTDSTHRDCQIKVFPNPFHTEFVVKALVSTHQIKEVQLVSAEGKILFEEAMPAGVNPLHLHLSSHPAAVYMLNYSCKGNTYRVKVVKD